MPQPLRVPSRATAIVLAALVSVAAALAVLAVLAAPAAHAADRLTCAGYAEHRQFVDAQSWWLRTPGRSGTSFGHVHLGGCIPEREVQRGTIGLDVRLVLHDNPGKVAEAVLVTKTNSSEVTRIHDRSLRGLTCPRGTCERWMHWNVPLSWFDRSGLQEIRYRAYVDVPDGNRMIVSLNFQTTIVNGRSRSTFSRMPYLRAKGWYTRSGYCEASLREPLPDAAVPWSHRFPVAVVDHGSGDLNPTHAIALRDADFHAGIPASATPSPTGRSACAPSPSRPSRRSGATRRWSARTAATRAGRPTPGCWSSPTRSVEPGRGALSRAARPVAVPSRGHADP